MSRFPVAFRLPAFRFSVIRFPPGSWALLTVGLPAQRPGPRRGYRVPHARAAAGVGASYTPRTAVLIPAEDVLSRRLPLYRGQSLHPAPASHHAGLRFTRHQREVHAIHPSGLPLACGRPDGTGALGLSPELRTPPTRSRRRTPRVGTGHRARTWNYSLNITSADPPIGSSLTTCDLASHRPIGKSWSAGSGACSTGRATALWCLLAARVR